MRLLRLDKILSGGSSHSFFDYFPHFDKVPTVRRIFGAKTSEVLRNLKVDFTWFGGYMWVNPANGHLMVSSHYLNEGARLDIYLDLVHELVHIRQLLDGAELFDEHFSYVERPTEVEAYRYAVEEARRIGVSAERICQYLRTEWMNDKEFQELAVALNIKCS